MKKSNLLLILEFLIIKQRLAFFYDKVVAVGTLQAASHEILMEKKKGYLDHNFLKFRQA